MKTRIIQTRIWNDEFFGGLNVIPKFLFVYSLTNERIGLTGAYECPDRVIIFETGLSQDQLDQSKKPISSKIIFINGWIVVMNAWKYNNYCSTEQQKKAYAKEYDLLPDFVKKYVKKLEKSVYTPSTPKTETKKEKPKYTVIKPKKEKQIINFGMDLKSEALQIIFHYKKIYNLTYMPKTIENSIAAGRLFENYGLDKVLYMIEMAKKFQKTKYFPSIGNLVDLLEKWENLDSMLSREGHDKPKQEEVDLTVKTMFGRENGA